MWAGGRTGVALAWPSTSHVTKAKADTYCWAGESQGTGCCLPCSKSMDSGTSCLGSFLVLVTNSNSPLKLY